MASTRRNLVRQIDTTICHDNEIGVFLFQPFLGIFGAGLSADAFSGNTGGDMVGKVLAAQSFQFRSS